METRNKKQAGFTLIELMIGILIGMIAVAATISAFISIVHSNSDYLKMVRLNQELNSVMTLMARDLKRAGYSAGANGKTNDNIAMVTTGIAGNDLYISNNCVTFTYDVIQDTGTAADNNNVINYGTGKIDERFGYRWDNTDHTVEARKSGYQCGETSWEDITDNDIINISNLTFTDNVLSVTTANLGEIRYIHITLTGSLVKDPAVTRTITERVRVRNSRP